MNKRYLTIAILVLAGVAGCQCSVPKSVADGIAQLNSNTHVLSEKHRVLIYGTGPITSKSLHDLALLKENEGLAEDILSWSELNRKKD